MTESPCLRSKPQLPKAARVCRAKPGNIVTRVLSTASVRRSGRFPALPYPPGGLMKLLQEFMSSVVLVLSATVLVLVLVLELVLETIAETRTHCHPRTARCLSALHRLPGVLVSDHEIASQIKSSTSTSTSTAMLSTSTTLATNFKPGILRLSLIHI